MFAFKTGSKTTGIYLPMVCEWTVNVFKFNVVISPTSTNKLYFLFFKKSIMDAPGKQKSYRVQLTLES